MPSCGSCAAQIIWAKSDKTGRAMPLDRDPSIKGNVRLFHTGVAVVLSGDQLAEARARGEKLLTSHFATCPNAAAHRGPR